MKKIITIGGSNSKNSISKQLAEYTGELIEKVELIKIDLNDFMLPIFSVDIEKEEGYSERLIKLHKIFDEADGFIVALAEHNGAYSVAFKNMFDWLSRLNSEVWRNKPMLLLATSTGVRGGKSVLQIALNRFPFNGGNIIESMSFPSFNENFKDGEIVNTEIKEILLKKVANYKKSI